MNASRAEVAGSVSTASRGNQFRNLLEEWRLGWRPGLAAIIGVSLGYSVWLHLSSLFVEPLQQEFGWSRGDIALANSAGMITGFAGPFLGRLVDKVGAKLVAMSGLVLSTLCFLALSQLGGSLTFYYTIYFFLTMTGMATTGITYGRIIVGTFAKSRGTSLALIRVGLAISQAVLPMLFFPVITQFGSTGGFLMLAAMNGLVTLPIVFSLVPGRRARTDTRSEQSAQTGPTRWQLLARQPKILILSLAAMLHSAPIIAIMTQLKPLGMSVGLDSGTAIGALSVLGIAPIIGALIAGLLVDRIWAPAVAVVTCVLSGTGCAMLAVLGYGISPAMFYLSAFLIGVGAGAESDVLAYMVARYFGVQDFATIAGVAGFFVVVGMAAAASLIGQAYDVFGNYQVAVIMAAVCIAAAGFGFLMMGRYPKNLEE